MFIFAVGSLPLIWSLNSIKEVTQVWYADDASSVGSFDALKEWFDLIKKNGPCFGYFPEPLKSFVVVDERSLTKANKVFADTEVNIVCNRRVLGGFIGDDLSRKDFVKEVVDGWVSELDRLTKIAEVQPQAAFAAFTKSLQFKWNYLQHVVPDCDALYKELKFNISNTFLPSVFGCEVSQAERKLFSLPARLGGLGISDPTEMNDVIFQWSRRATDLIVQSIKDDQVFEIGAHVNCLKEVKSETLESKTLLNVEKFETILSHFDQRAILRANKEKNIISVNSATSCEKAF